MFAKATILQMCVFGLSLTVLPEPTEAQEMPRAAAEVSAGWIGFPDDGEMVGEGLVGGTVRWHLTPRVSVGPEVAWIAGQNHSHLMLTGNVTFDLLSPRNNRPAPMTPFIVAGGGMFRTTESFVNVGDFSSTEGAFTVGGGVRANPTDRMTLGVEARLGWELHLRINWFICVRLAKGKR